MSGAFGLGIWCGRNLPPLRAELVPKAQPIGGEFQEPRRNQPLHLQLWLGPAGSREHYKRTSKLTECVQANLASSIV